LALTDTLLRLEQVIKDRDEAGADNSYVVKMMAKGLPELARKVGEEATETLIAAISYEKKELVGEAADLLFHLLLLLRARHVKIADVLAELDRREGTSGLAEKAARGN
jgi:phosphoribosyl-ATP pyrophosphohydrolase